MVLMYCVLSVLPDYTQITGRCIYCPHTNVGRLIGVVLLAFMLVYIVHRLPHDWSGSATSLIMAYFIQQSVVFLASESLPQILALLNVNLLGDHTSRGNDYTSINSNSNSGDNGDGDSSNGNDVSSFYSGFCIVPLSDYGRILMALISPMIAVLLLLLIGAIQLVFRYSLKRDVLHSSSRSLHISAGERIYCFLFMPSAISTNQPTASASNYTDVVSDTSDNEDNDRRHRDDGDVNHEENNNNNYI